MFSTLIALDGSAVDTRLVDLAGPLLAGRELELTLLPVMPVPPGALSAVLVTQARLCESTRR